MTPVGAPPTSIVCFLPVRGLNRVSVPPLSATQTLPAPMARPSGFWPTGIASETRLPAGSRRSSSPVWLVTQTAPSPAATVAGDRVDPGYRVAGHVGDPDRPGACGDRARADPGPDCRDLGSGSRVHLRDGAVDLVRDPDLAAGDHD